MSIKPLAKTIANILVIFGLYQGASVASNPLLKFIRQHTAIPSTQVSPPTVAQDTVAPQIDTVEVRTLPQQLVTNARTFLGRKYDSVYKNGRMYDGQSQYNSTTQQYFVSYKSGRSASVDDKPFVCDDLIVESLKKISDSFLDVSAAQDDEFYLRKVVNLEKEFKKSSDFQVENCDTSTQYIIGDIITTMGPKKRNRHIGIVTEVTKDGKPSKMIHSSYSAEGVVENTYNDFLVDGKYRPVMKISLIDEAKTTAIVQ